MLLNLVERLKVPPSALRLDEKRGFDGFLVLAKSTAHVHRERSTDL